MFVYVYVCMVILIATMLTALALNDVDDDCGTIMVSACFAICLTFLLAQNGII